MKVMDPQNSFCFLTPHEQFDDFNLLRVAYIFRMSEMSISNKIPL